LSSLYSPLKVTIGGGKKDKIEYEIVDTQALIHSYHDEALAVRRLLFLWVLIRISFLSSSSLIACYAITLYSQTSSVRFRSFPARFGNRDKALSERFKVRSPFSPTTNALQCYLEVRL